MNTGKVIFFVIVGAVALVLVYALARGYKMAVLLRDAKGGDVGAYIQANREASAEMERKRKVYFEEEKNKLGAEGKNTYNIVVGGSSAYGIKKRDYTEEQAIEAGMITDAIIGSVGATPLAQTGALQFLVYRYKMKLDQDKAIQATQAWVVQEQKTIEKWQKVNSIIGSTIFNIMLTIADKMTFGAASGVVSTSKAVEQNRYGDPEKGSSDFIKSWIGSSVGFLGSMGSGAIGK